MQGVSPPSPVSAMTSKHMQALVFNLRYEAQGVVSVELRPAENGTEFPPVEAGAHIDLHLSNGLVRSYSLTNPGESRRYVVAVLKDKNSRGGSAHIHEQLRIGQKLQISTPRNHFALDETASHSVLVAGGIGITPIYSMLQRLRDLGRSAELIYCARSRAEAAYLEPIETLVKSMKGHSSPLALTLHFDQEQGRPPNMMELLAGRSHDTHFYCCGPAPMLDAFEKACEVLSQTHVHLERFGATAKPTSATNIGTGYDVELRKSCKTLHVPPGVSLLDSLLDAGLQPEFSCREGICGACETRVISGDVDHQDQILTKQEKAANKSMMICVSGCRSGTLVLDL